MNDIQNSQLNNLGNSQTASYMQFLGQSCPHCGRCPHCGHVPYNGPYPYWPNTYPMWTVQTNQTTSAGGQNLN